MGAALLWSGLLLARWMPSGQPLMKIVLLVLLFFYVIAFFWIIWKSATNWRWYHMVAASLTFLLTIPLLPLTAVVLKSRSEWSKVAEDLELRLAKGEREKEQWINGVPGDPQRDPGLLEMQTRLRSLNTEVGRVFRDLELRDRGPNGFVLGQAAPAAPVSPDGLPVEEPPADGAAPAVAGGPLVAQGTVVYAFVERVLQEGGPFLPVYYLGEYRVTAAAADAVTIVPTSPLEPGQLRAANESPRWVLYEVMPTDGHLVYVADGSVPDDEQIFGRVNEELVRSLMGSAVTPQTLESYLRDGARARDDDSPASRWDKVEFTKKYELTVDAMEQRSAGDGGFFDNLGQAVDSRLQRAENDVVTFEVGDQLVVKAEAAEQLITEGVARRIDRYYVRPLNSYKLVLPMLRQHIDYLNQQTANLQRQQGILQTAVDLTTQMQTEGQQRKIELEKDEAQIAKELAALNAYVAQLQAELTTTRNEMARLYRDNLRSESELEAIHRAILESANRRATGVGS